MIPNYENWMPKYLIVIGYLLTGVFFLLLLLFLIGVFEFENSGLNIGVKVVLLLLTVFLGGWAILFQYMHYAFSYDGEIQISRKVIDYTAKNIHVAPECKILDVGCGSGALTIACAKYNPKAKVVGLDRWGMEYAKFSKALCENNAKAEGVTNVEFIKGDATKLDLPKDSFDGVVSNYVYHNIKGYDLQKILDSTLSLLKKGGTFAIHDLFNERRYGNMEDYLLKLRNEGYERVELIPTDSGDEIDDKMMKRTFLKGSALLVGKK